MLLWIHFDLIINYHQLNGFVSNMVQLTSLGSALCGFSSWSSRATCKRGVHHVNFNIQWSIQIGLCRGIRPIVTSLTWPGHHPLVYSLICWSYLCFYPTKNPHLTQMGCVPNLRSCPCLLFCHWSCLWIPWHQHLQSCPSPSHHHLQSCPCPWQSRAYLRS